jgi:cyclopropane fatty-acyl-phospholipid synthase-like methyltransferase
MTSLRSRLSAWWEGEEGGDDDAAAGGGIGGANSNSDVMADGAGWPAPRLAAAQMLFGEGCTFPGSKLAITQLIEPLQLSQDMTVVDIGAGIGTATRIIAQETGAKVEGLERDPGQVELARHFADQAGLAGQAIVLEGALGNCAIEPDSRDAIFGREALLGEADKATAFMDMWTMLKPGGQILLADFVAKTPAGTKEDAAEWAKFEKMKPHMATMDQIKQGLSATHLDVHLADDISDAFCSHILRGLAGLTDTLKQGSVPKDQRPWVMWEVELWARRVATLKAGNIGFYRFHASKAAE